MFIAGVVVGSAATFLYVRAARAAAR